MKTPIILLLISLSFDLYGQIDRDKDYKSPYSFEQAKLDSIRIFEPGDIELIEIYSWRGGYDFEEKQTREHAELIGRVKFDRAGRITEEELFLPGSYSVNDDRFVGYHMETLEYHYLDDQKTVISYANTAKLKKYSWTFEDSLLQSCHYFRGEKPFLQSFWKWSYNKENFLVEVAKFNYDTTLEYISTYSYDELDRLRQIQTTVPEKGMNFYLFDYQGNRTNRVFYKSLKKVPREIYTTENGIFVGKTAPIRGKRRSEMFSKIYDVNGRVIEKLHYRKSGKLKRRVVIKYHSDGRLNEKDYYDHKNELVGRLTYTYNQELLPTAIEYTTERVEKWILGRYYKLKYDDRGNVKNLLFVDNRKSRRIRVDFDYHYRQK